MSVRKQLEPVEPTAAKIERHGLSLTFRGMNQEAVMSVSADERGLYRFEYANAFYGSCVIKSRIREEPNVRLFLDSESLEVQLIDARNEAGETLEASAIRFVNRQLRQFFSLTQLTQKNRWSQWRQIFSKPA